MRRVVVVVVVALPLSLGAEEEEEDAIIAWILSFIRSSSSVGAVIYSSPAGRPARILGIRDGVELLIASRRRLSYPLY